MVITNKCSEVILDSFLNIFCIFLSDKLVVFMVRHLLICRWYLIEESTKQYNCKNIVNFGFPRVPSQGKSTSNCQILLVSETQRL